MNSNQNGPTQSNAINLDALTPKQAALIITALNQRVQLLEGVVNSIGALMPSIQANVSMTTLFEPLLAELNERDWGEKRTPPATRHPHGRQMASLLGFLRFKGGVTRGGRQCHPLRVSLARRAEPVWLIRWSVGRSGRSARCAPLRGASDRAFLQ